MTAYAELDTNKYVTRQIGRADPPDFVGPDEPEPPVDPGMTCRKLAADIDYSGQPTPTSRMQWLDADPAPKWAETKTLDELKAIKNAEINAGRLTANLSSFPYAGKQIACDALSRSDIDAVNGYVSLTGGFRVGWAGLWKATDNSYVDVSTVDAWKAFYAAMVDQGQANFSHAQDLKSQLASATTAEAVASINW